MSLKPVCFPGINSVPLESGVMDCPYCEDGKDKSDSSKLCPLCGGTRKMPLQGMSSEQMWMDTALWIASMAPDGVQYKRRTPVFP